MRRAVASAAATAVIAPLALLAAPAAYATGTSGTDQSTAQSEGDPGADEETATGEQPAAEPPAEESPAEESPAGEEEPVSEEKPVVKEPVEQCEAVEDGDGVTATVNGVPEQIYSDGGWETFSLTVTNHTDEPRELTSAHVWKEAFNESLPDATRYVRIQANPDGTWAEVGKKDGSDDSGLTGWSSLAADETASLQMRIRVDRAPSSLGVALNYAFHVAGGNTCAEKVSDRYLFNVIPAGGNPNGNDSTPQGEEPKPVKPTEATEPTDVKPDADPEQSGHLAETGSDTNLPAFGLAGAAAVALGAGAMFVVRRRRDADTAA
ncbi:LPXTG cell wall anchor domain-containing protein [Streptomyces sp. TRM 70351]|uniref:LPXTG cell wall anchor domain-containing protein n=1 Tax=Streptomyces sp. TRM 70351 TaxID=3116552 RepID=UPI002E7C1796|nr:LPXTG cell wall anchor domain-containing protein [Streptomyces sp. TRM 70351]MEE1929574.1 LPXTG cell wall anchor domain-containing protein [Streptomyces sp. TRM 70351]